MRWKLAAQTKPLIHLRHAKSFVSRAACKVPHCQKWDCHALPLFALDRAIPRRLFSISILIAGETPKTGAPNLHVGACGNPVFGVATWRPERLQLLQKFTRIMRPQKPKRMTQTSMCSPGEDHLWESKIYIDFQPKNGHQTIEQFNMSPGLRKKAQDAQDAALRFLKFQFQSRWQDVWDFWGFWDFQFTMQFTRWTAVLRFWRFQFQSHWLGVWDFFSNGDSEYYNTIRRGPQAGGHQGSGHHPPESS